MARVIQINPAERIPGPYPPDRECADPGCTTVLSVYNPAEVCYACQADLSPAEAQELVARRVMRETPLAA